jgi:hypothetical protein
MFQGEIFWMIMGALSVLVGIGAVLWAQDLGLKMNWFKWVLVVLWYLLLWLTVASPLTLIGENEAAAGLKIIPFLVVPTGVLGVALWRYLKFEPKKE